MPPPDSGSGLTLDDSTQLFRLLSDATRLRLLRLLELERFSVAELTEILGLAQGRVSSHLAKLREAGMVIDEREGSSVYYSTALEDTGPVQDIYASLGDILRSSELDQDAERAAQVLAARSQRSGWASSVAGRMERHYSPGRTWEATARALCGLLDLGDVLDIGSGDGVLAELLAGHARNVTCVDNSETVMDAARQRLAQFGNVKVETADMHALPFENAQFDICFLMHVLSYTQDAAGVIAEAARVLRPEGRLVIATLARHNHHATVAAYDHVVDGVDPADLRTLIEHCELRVTQCEITSRETRPPYFEVVTAFAQRTD